MSKKSKRISTDNYDEKLDPTGHVCCSCETTKELRYSPDPFASEIRGDDTPVWECEDCRYQSCQDI